MMQAEMTRDAVVIGGGLAGLTAAIYLAKAGCSVTLLEKAGHAGGRATTTERGSARLNLGPHALYQAGAAARVLNDLGCMPDGATPPRKAFGIREGKVVLLPTTPGTMLGSPAFSWGDKLELVRVLGGLRKLDPQQYASVSLQEWIQRSIRRPIVRDYFLGFSRVATYGNVPEAQSAGAVLRQMRLALSGVRYVHGGWRTIVDRLVQAACLAGVEFRPAAAAEQVETEAGWVRGVRLAEGQGTIAASAVVVAAGPDELCRLMPATERATAEQWRSQAVPVRAACLDLVLRRMPRPALSFAFGLDCPLYFANHSSVARLTGDGTMVVHAMKYLDGRETDPQVAEMELERMMDMLQPGWRNEVVVRRYMPRLTVTHDARTIRHGGAGAAPRCTVPEVKGLYVAGDWVGPEGMLADAAFASGRQAALDAALLFGP